MPSPRAALEAALADNPEDLAAHAAYADLLAEEGDPRGEFIQVQLALEQGGRSPRDRQELQAREKALLRAHRREWLGALNDYFVPPESVEPGTEVPAPGWRFQFARGWLDDLEVDQLSGELAAVLAREPQARLLRRLLVRYDFLGPGPAPASVRAFQLGRAGNLYLGHFSPHLPSFIAGMNRLEELRLYCRPFYVEPLFRLPMLDRLRVLHVEGMRLTPLSVLAANQSLKRLAELHLHPWDMRGMSPIPSEEVRALVRSQNLPRLAQLHLDFYLGGDTICRDIVRSGVLRRLKVLELNYGDITDEGARVLARSPYLGHLERLDVSYNQLTEDGIAALQATGVPVIAEDQGEDGDGPYQWEGWE